MEKSSTETKWRKLWFDTIDECRQEVDRIVAAEQAGTLVPLGNWTPGQIMAHISAWIEYGHDGYPIGPPPFFIRLFMRMLRGYLIRNGMKPGVKIPGVAGGTVGQDPMETLAAADRLRTALKRLDDGEEARFDSPAFGPMSHEDRVALNLRHAALHLGFLSYE